MFATQTTQWYVLRSLEWSEKEGAIISDLEGMWLRTF